MGKFWGEIEVRNRPVTPQMNRARPPRLVVCVNQRLGAGQRSCAGSGSVH